MINVVVPITENAEKFNDFIKKFSGKDVKFYVGVTKNLADKIEKKTGAQIFVFENKSNREQIINALHEKKKEKGKILVVRRPLTDNEFKLLTNSKAELVSLKKHRNKFARFFKNLGRVIVRKIFAFSVFDDISAVCFGESMFDLISVCPNLSIATRVNKYIGVSFEEVETGEKTVKVLYNKPKTFGLYFLETLFFLANIAGGILIFIFVKNLLFVFGMLIVLWWLLAIFLWMMCTTFFVRTVELGNVENEKAKQEK